VSIVAVLCSWGRASAFDPSEWTEPEPLSETSSRYHDKAPFLSFDGLSLYFARDLGSDYAHIYTATRKTPEGPFGEPWENPELNSARANVDCPWVSPDNRRIYYYSTERNYRRLRMSEKSMSTGWWRTPSDIQELNRLGEVGTPALTEDELTIVFGGLNFAEGKGGWDLWTAGRPDKESPFADVRSLAEVNSGAFDVHPYITPDGLVLYFTSNRNGAYQIFEAVRPSLDSPFGAPVHIAALDTPDGDSQYPRLSADGDTFIYGRWKKGGKMDIYTSHKVDLEGNGVRLIRAEGAGSSPWGSRVYPSIQEAIETAQDGDTVVLHPGVYREAISFLGKAITVQSVGDAAILEMPEGTAVSFGAGEGSRSVLRNIIIRNSRIGILLVDSSPIIVNVAVVGNILGVEAQGNADPYIGDSIFWSNTQDDLRGCTASYSCVERLCPGLGNFSKNPLFVDPAKGDYHVQSRAGRYCAEQGDWVLDKATSPCVDAGDPAADFSSEPEPNGGRLNVGAHGGTAYAEKSESHI